MSLLMLTGFEVERHGDRMRTDLTLAPIRAGAAIIRKHGRPEVELRLVDLSSVLDHPDQHWALLNARSAPYVIRRAAPPL